MSRSPPAASPEELLAHAAWLRRLAHHLVGGAADADDLVQDTWLAALRRPPATDRPLRPWLAEVLRNFVRMRVRGDRRRGAREQAQVDVGPAAAPSAAELVDRVETQRLLAALVVELDEPYRSTVLLRYVEGLTAARIAELQGVPAGTVRWRLKAGLDRLRGELDRR